MTNVKNHNLSDSIYQFTFTYQVSLFKCEMLNVRSMSNVKCKMVDAPSGGTCV